MRRVLPCLLAPLLLLAACDDGVRVADENTGAQRTVSGAVPDGYRLVCDESACGPVAASAEFACLGTRALRFADVCVEASRGSDDCVWLFVSCDLAQTGSLDSGVPQAADAAAPALDGGTDAGYDSGDAGADAAIASDAAVADDGGAPAMDGGTSGVVGTGGCGPSDCGSSAPTPPACFDGSTARVECARSSSGLCGYVFACGEP